MVVFSKPKIKILTYLIDKRLDEFSINELSKKLSLDYKDSNVAIKNLEAEGLISVKSVGNSLICKITNKFSPILYYVEFLRRDLLLKNRIFKTLHKDLELIDKPFICLVFGSQIKGEVNKSSDIDLLFITEFENEIEKIINRYPFPIHANFFTYKEFLTMANSKEFSVVSEILKKNVILIGIEEFYRVMINVK